ncbi:MAG: septum formation protein Maf [Ignavibacteria bacterium]|nr:septum formation protein Maf [Ignavibacteria bacterium]
MSLLELSKLPLVLASNSPRRKHLLSVIGLKFESVSPDVDETPIKNETPLKFAQRIAKEKNEIVSSKFTNKIILSADTIVVLGNKILNKPKDKVEASKMLKSLSGKTHKVITAITLNNQIKKKILRDHEITKVTFRKLQLSEIEEYVEGGTCMDKAGSYGIQEDFGAVFVENVNGCYYNIMGLPLTKTYQMLQETIK